MMLSNLNGPDSAAYYWVFKNGLTNKFCDEVVRYSLSQKDSIAVTGGFEKKKLSKEDLKKLKSVRDSNVVWLNENWIYKEIHPFVIEANKKAGWNFQWDYSEDCQFTKYKIGQYYTWHTDTILKKSRDDKIRKLSMSCILSNSNEYEGGEFEFDSRNYNPNMRDEYKHIHRINNKLPKGSIIIFPSFMWHRVKPVTSGTRYSLVSWQVGDPFK